MPQASDGGFEVAFRIDEEIGGHYDHLTVLHALDNFDAVLRCARRPSLRGARTPLP